METNRKNSSVRNETTQQHSDYLQSDYYKFCRASRPDKFLSQILQEYLILTQIRETIPSRKSHFSDLGEFSYQNGILVYQFTQNIFFSNLTYSFLHLFNPRQSFLATVYIRGIQACYQLNFCNDWHSTQKHECLC